MMTAIFLKSIFPEIPGLQNLFLNLQDLAKTVPEVTEMIDYEQLPIGFTMEFAMHSDVLSRFSNLPKEQQKAVIDGARTINSRSEMREYVESIFK